MFRPCRGFSRVRRRESLQWKRGFSLLEVVLALAILAGSIAVIGELVRIGARSAEGARDLTQAQFLCESKLAEITSGLAAVESLQTTICPEDENFVYSVDVESTSETGLVAVRVTVARNLPAHLQPVDFSLVQWLPDPAATTSSSTTQDQSSTSGTTGVGNG
jgi:type II secretion system protein I